MVPGLGKVDVLSLCGLQDFIGNMLDQMERGYLNRKSPNKMLSEHTAKLKALVADNELSVPTRLLLQFLDAVWEETRKGLPPMSGRNEAAYDQVGESLDRVFDAIQQELAKF